LWKRLCSQEACDDNADGEADEQCEYDEEGLGHGDGEKEQFGFDGLRVLQNYDENEEDQNNYDESLYLFHFEIVPTFIVQVPLAMLHRVVFIR